MANVGITTFRCISFSSTGRWDAPFWIKIHSIMKARGFSLDNKEAFQEVIKEVEERKEFPGGSNPSKNVPKHNECLNCLSWQVDFVETNTRRETDGVIKTDFSGDYKCRRCGASWHVIAGGNDQGCQVPEAC